MAGRARKRQVLSWLCVAAAFGCDDGRVPEANAGSVSSVKDAGARSARDTDASAPSAPGTGGSTSSPTPPGSVDMMGERVVCAEPVPGDDACLACALSRCCQDETSRVAACLSSAYFLVDGGVVWDPLYRTDGGLPGEALCFRAVRIAQECFENELATSSSVDSWYIVAACADDVLSDPVSIDAGVGLFPFNDDPGTELVECIVGSRPASADEDGGGADAGRPLFPRNRFGFQEEHCAEECFPGWR